MTVTATETRVFLEQALLHVEAEVLGLGVVVASFDFRCGELIDLAIAEQHIEQRLAAYLRLLGDQLRGPHFLDLEALRKLHELPQVAACLTGGSDEIEL